MVSTFKSDQFLQCHDVKDKPSRIWIADEAGFPLCPKISEVIAMTNASNVMMFYYYKQFKSVIR